MRGEHIYRSAFTSALCGCYILLCHGVSLSVAKRVCEAQRLSLSRSLVCAIRDIRRASATRPRTGEHKCIAIIIIALIKSPRTKGQFPHLRIIKHRWCGLCKSQTHAHMYTYIYTHTHSPNSAHKTIHACSASSPSSQRNPRPDKFAAPRAGRMLVYIFKNARRAYPTNRSYIVYVRSLNVVAPSRMPPPPPHPSATRQYKCPRYKHSTGVCALIVQLMQKHQNLRVLI